jgi:hypothetical protein
MKQLYRAFIRIAEYYFIVYSVLVVRHLWIKWIVWYETCTFLRGASPDLAIALMKRDILSDRT